MTTTFKIFYTLPQLDDRQGRPVVYWVTDPRLYSHLEAILRKAPLVTEAILAQRLLSALQQNTENDLVKGHLVAFLSQECLNVAKKVKNDLNRHTRISNAPDNSLEDLLQIALESVLNPLAFLKDFKPNKAQKVFWYSALKKYIYCKLQGILIDHIRGLEGMKTFKRTDLGLAIRATQKRVIDALEYCGQKHPQLSRYVLAWKCLKEVKDAGRINISSPQPRQFQEITDRYNQLRDQLPLTTEQNPAINGAVMEEWLNQIGKAIRSYIDQRVESLNVPSAGEDSSTLIEKLTDESTVNDPGIQERREQAKTIKIFITNQLTNTLEALDNLQQQIPFFKHGLQLVQVQISSELDIAQPTVGRRYKNFKKLLDELLLEIAQGEWRSQLETEKPIELSSESLEILKKELLQQVDDYYTDFIYPNFRIALGNLSVQNRNVLQYNYILHLDTTVIAGKLQIPEDRVNSILETAKETIEQYLVESIQNRLDLTFKPKGPAREGIVILTEQWFQIAPYQELQ